MLSDTHVASTGGRFKGIHLNKIFEKFLNLNTLCAREKQRPDFLVLAGDSSEESRDRFPGSVSEFRRVDLFSPN